MRVAYSAASAPPLVKKTMFKSPGASSAINRAASLREAFANGGATVQSFPACSCIAATNFGC